MSNADHEKWQFCLTPADVGQLPERLSDFVRYAEGKGLKIGTVTISVEPQPGEEPVAIRVRKLLKHALRDCGLRASWPDEPRPDFHVGCGGRVVGDFDPDQGPFLRCEECGECFGAPRGPSPLAA